MIIGIDNLVKQVTADVGAGDLTLSTSPGGTQTFSGAFGTGVTTDTFYYFISHTSSVEWEIGSGHMSDAVTLVRDTVLKSSNANNPVVFSVGLKAVVNDLPADIQKKLEKAFVYNEEPVGLIDDLNVVFTTSLDFAAGTTCVYLNGLRLRPGIGKAYVESGINQITMTDAPSSGDDLTIDYQQL